MSENYETRQDLIDQRDRLEEALSVILDEMKKEEPDLDFVEETTLEALGLSDESDEDGD